MILPMDLGLPEFKEFGYGTAEDEGGSMDQPSGSMDQPSGSGSGSDDVMIEENRK